MEHYRQSLENVLRTIDDLREQLDEIERVTREGLADARTGSALMDQKTQWPERIRARERLIEALTAVNSTMMRARAHFIRVLVDEEGQKIADLALMLGNSRQLVKRQYDAAHVHLNASTNDGSGTPVLKPAQGRDSGSR